MADLSSWMAPIAFVYASAASGGFIALLVRASARRAGRDLSPSETKWNAFLPLLSALLLPVAILLLPHSPELLTPLHHLWHRWELALHASPVAHAGLHVTNWALLLGAVFCGMRVIYTVSRICSFARSLAVASRPTRQHAVDGSLHLLDSPRPLCFTFGLLRPATYLSSSLQRQLSQPHLTAMLAHEAAHVRRQDTRTATLLTLFYTLIPLPGSRWLLSDWRRASEQACDAEAARAVGDPCLVAEALIRVTQLSQGITGPRLLGSSFSGEGEAIEERVRALLALPSDETSPGADAMQSVWLPAISLGLVLATGMSLQHLVELFVHH